MKEKKFSSFEELNQYHETIEKENREEKFKKYISGQFSKLHGNFKSSIKGIDSITLIPGPADKNGEVNNAYVIPHWKTEKGQEYTTLSLTKDGVLNGNIPKDLEKIVIDKKELYKELLYLAETIDLNFFENTDYEIISSDETDKEILKSKSKDPRKSEKSIIDPRRINFFIKQPNVLFGVSGKHGLRGYKMFIFQEGVVYENQNIGNAIYIQKLKKPIKIDESRFNLDASKRVTLKEREEIIKNISSEFNNSDQKGVTKNKIINIGGKKFVHPKTKESNEAWEKRMTIALKTLKI